MDFADESYPVSERGDLPEEADHLSPGNVNINQTRKRRAFRNDHPISADAPTSQDSALKKPGPTPAEHTTYETSIQEHNSKEEIHRQYRASPLPAETLKFNE